MPHTRNDYSIPTPCEASSSSLTDREGGWYCQQCQHEVIDASKMTREEFERYEREHGEELCVSFYFDADGEIQFASPEQKRWQKQLAGVAKLIATASIPPLLLAGCIESESRSKEAASEAVPSIVEAAEPAPKPAASRAPSFAPAERVESSPSPDATDEEEHVECDGVEEEPAAAEDAPEEPKTKAPTKRVKKDVPRKRHVKGRMRRHRDEPGSKKDDKIEMLDNW